MPSSGRSDLLRRALRLTSRDWADIARAVIWLARARRIHRANSAADLLERARRMGAAPGQNPALAGRISLAIPRAAARVPWRSDCWVQAIAAQGWLARHGCGSELRIGVRKNAAGFAAHAWLRHGEITVTGGDFSSYQPMVSAGAL